MSVWKDGVADSEEPGETPGRSRHCEHAMCESDTRPAQPIDLGEAPKKGVR